MIIQADRLINNKEKNTVTAEGNVRIYYKGDILEADRVVYNRNTDRIYAEGHAKLTEKDGTVLHAQHFDLTQDFRDGFLASVRASATNKTYFSAPHAERINGNTTVFEKGTYTACASCAKNPNKAPLWRVRAMKIVHNKEEQMVYYTNAWLEFVGIPVAYFPFFSSPDPNVKRKSGILSPQYMENSYLGQGVSVPIFWALAPNYDLTFTPTYFSRQGFFGDLIWRHRLTNGSYYVRANGIFEQAPKDFPSAPYGAGDRRLRGELESKGKFQIAPRWTFGWNIALLSDRWYINDYQIPTQARSAYYISDITSTAHLTGQGARSYFDLRGFYFEGLTSHDFQQQQPFAGVWDYNRVFDIDPAKTRGVGGQVEFDLDLSSVSAAAAAYEAVGAHQYDHAYGLYDICAAYKPGTTTGSCLLRGIGGNYTRMTMQASWQRKFIDPIGEVWSPFAFARVNGQWLDLNTSRSYTFSSANGTSTLANASQGNFLGATNAVYGYVMPGAGVEYRYPFLANVPFGSLTIEPIAQVIGRPNHPLGTTSLINIDSQSLVFDDTTLFAWNKYSGYDRFETGLRANYGGEATYSLYSGGYVNVVAGQSYQLAGTNSYATPDAANIGLSSGLDTPFSDYVAAFTMVPGPLLSFTAKGRFDQATLSPRRVDLMTNFNLGAWTGSVQYANYAAQPVLGYQVRREGLSLSSRYNITKNYFMSGGVTFDMSRQFYSPPLVSFNPGPFAISAFGLLGGFHNDCTTFLVSYTNTYQDNGAGSYNHNQTVRVSLQLRTLGDWGYSRNFITNPAGQIVGGVN